MSQSIEVGFSSSPEIENTDIPVSGEIPKWVSGTLLRNGPGTFKIGNQRYRHWFDGLAMLHRFSINDGSVSYSNKFLESRSYSEALENGKIMYSEFATDPCRSLFARAMAVFKPDVTDSAKVNIAKLADHYLALAETPIQIEFDPETLKSVGVTSWDSSNFGRMTTVHPHTDSLTNEAFNLVTRYGAVSSYCFRRFGLDKGIGESSDLTSFRSLQPSYIHSFGMSKSFLILVEYPLVVNPLALLLWLKPYIENFKWKPELGTKFHVFRRSDGSHVKSMNFEAFFSFHHVNAFESNDSIQIDMVVYEDSEIIDAFYLKRLEDPNMSIPSGYLKRFSIPLSGKGEISRKDLSSINLELPSFDYTGFNTSEKLSFVYGISNKSEMGFYDQLVKINLGDGSYLTWHEEGCYPGEAVFVGRPGRSTEDDGILLSVVLDSRKGNSFLLVLDARDLKEIARAFLDHPILFGYHGIFSERDIAQQNC